MLTACVYIPQTPLLTRDDFAASWCGTYTGTCSSFYRVNTLLRLVHQSLKLHTPCVGVITKDPYNMDATTRCVAVEHMLTVSLLEAATWLNLKLALDLAHSLWLLAAQAILVHPHQLTKQKHSSDAFISLWHGIIECYVCRFFAVQASQMWYETVSMDLVATDCIELFLADCKSVHSKGRGQII